MRKRPSTRRGHPEKGVTMAFVAISLIALIGVAALAIDVATLYASKAEAQRAADVAALAGAQALIDSGVTGDPSNLYGNWAAACDTASAQATAVAAKNKIANQNVVPANLNVCFPNSNSGCTPCASASSPANFGANPQVSVTVTRIDLPLFFSRIWTRNAPSVSATAIAEGFNPSGSNIPVAPKCVKPWLIPNMDPYSPNPATPVPFVDPATGNIVRPGLQVTNGAQGESFRIQSCPNPGAPCIPAQQAPKVYTGGGIVGLQYYPLDIPLSPLIRGPACWNSSASASYIQNIEACNPTPVACGDTVKIAQAVVPEGPGGGINLPAIACLINATGGGSTAGQDSLNTTLYPFQIQAGPNDPLVLGGNIATNDVITNSSSVINIPIYQQPAGVPVPAPTATVTVVGFLQVFVDRVGAQFGRPFITVLNVAGCGPGSTGQTPLFGSGQTALPVRLIRN